MLVIQLQRLRKVATAKLCFKIPSWVTGSICNRDFAYDTIPIIILPLIRLLACITRLSTDVIFNDACVIAAPLIPCAFI